MDLRATKMLPLFCLSLITTLFLSQKGLSLSLLPFTPFCIAAIYRYPFEKALWLSFSIGFVLDLVNAGAIAPFLLGITGATLCTYPLKRHFFSDHLTTIPLLTSIHTLSTLLILTCLNIHFSWSEWIQFPLITTLYAALTLTVPSFLFGRKIRKGEEYFIM